MQCDPGSELRLGGRENKRAKIINGMENKKEVYSVEYVRGSTTGSDMTGWRLWFLKPFDFVKLRNGGELPQNRQ